MVVYGEYLFLENLITGILLIMLTARLTGSPYNKFRLVTGGIICGLSGFAIFLSLNDFLAIAVRGVIAAIVVLTAFGKTHLIKRTAIFLSLTFLSGGAAMAFFIWQGVPSLSGNGVLYIETFTYIRLMCIGVLAFGMTYWFIKLIKAQRKKDISIDKVRLIIGEKTFSFMAFVDSGNCLKDPLSGKPVILIDKTGREELPFSPEDFPERCALIPYKAVGTVRGFLTGIRLDEMIFDGVRIKGVVMAYYDGNFDGFRVLLNQEVLERGMLANA